MSATATVTKASRNGNASHAMANVGNTASVNDVNESEEVGVQEMLGTDTVNATDYESALTYLATSIAVESLIWSYKAKTGTLLKSLWYHAQHEVALAREAGNKDSGRVSFAIPTEELEENLVAVQKDLTTAAMALQYDALPAYVNRISILTEQIAKQRKEENIVSYRAKLWRDSVAASGEMSKALGFRQTKPKDGKPSRITDLQDLVTKNLVPLSSEMYEAIKGAEREYFSVLDDHGSKDILSESTELARKYFRKNKEVEDASETSETEAG